MLCNHEIQQRCVEMKELISVIVPVYKVEKYIATCLESILKQTYSNLEIIVVNDGSPDNAMSIVEEYAAKDSRIKCYSKENGGLSSARNCGLERMTGEYYTFVDSDDEILPEMIEKLYDRMRATNADVSTCGRIVRYQNNDRVRFCEERIIEGKEKVYREFLTRTIQHSVWAKLFKADTKLYFEKGIIFEDTEWCSRYMLLINRVATCDFPGYIYCMRSDSTTHSALSTRNFDYVYVIQKIKDNILALNIDCREEFLKFKLDGYLHILKRAIKSKKYNAYSDKSVPLVRWIKDSIKFILQNILDAIRKSMHYCSIWIMLLFGNCLPNVYGKERLA